MGLLQRTPHRANYQIATVASWDHYADSALAHVLFVGRLWGIAQGWSSGRIIQPQAAPLPLRTAGMVLARILKSSQSDHSSMY